MLANIFMNINKQLLACNLGELAPVANADKEAGCTYVNSTRPWNAIMQLGSVSVEYHLMPAGLILLNQNL